jgi:hypothetical protein
MAGERRNDVEAEPQRPVREAQPNRLVSAPRNLPPAAAALLALQREAGNAAVSRLVESGALTGEVAGPSTVTEDEPLVIAGEGERGPAQATLEPQYRPGTPLGDSLYAHELGHGLHKVVDGLGRRPEARATEQLTGEAPSKVSGRTRGLALQRCTKPPPPLPLLRKKTVSGPTTSSCGGFSWGAQWYLDNPGTTDGFVVQHVRTTFDVKDDAGSPVDVKTKSGGAIDPAWWPIWEAWQVRGGKVYVGTTTTPHSADTYGIPALGAGTKGKISILGKADYYPGLTLPASMTAKNAAPAWALPVTTTDPALTGGTGSLDHNIVATWDCTSGSSDHKTTVTTT